MKIAVIGSVCASTIANSFAQESKDVLIVGSKPIEPIKEKVYQITKPNYIDFSMNAICGRGKRRLRRKQQRKI